MVARLGHFGRAAEACNVSQPALSTQIKKLEFELGVNLFERDNRSVRITTIGEKIIQLTDEALDIIETIRATAEAAHDPLSGVFTLGSIPTISPYLMPQFVRLSQKAFPSLKLEFQEDITERLNEALLEGSLDAAILATPPESPKLETISLYDEPFWALFPTHHDLKLTRHVKTQDLPVDELLLLSEGHCFRDQALDVCRMGDAIEKRTIRATSLETLINMVAAGQGITLVPAMALSGGWTTDERVQASKLVDSTASRRIYLTFRKSFPRRQLLEETGEIICAHLPKGVVPIR